MRARFDWLRGRLTLDGVDAPAARVNDEPFAVDTIPSDPSTTEVIGAPGSRTSAVDSVGDHDWFRVTLTEGVSYSFALTGTGPDALSDPYLALYNPAGTLVGFDNDSGPGLNSLIPIFVAPSTGDYYLSVTGMTSNVGTYTLEALVLGEGQDSILGDTSTGHSLVINGPSASSAIETAGDQDWFAITLTAGESYTFTLSGDGDSPLSDAYLEIRGSIGSLIALDDDGGVGLDSLMQFTAPYSGTYYLAAQGYGAATGGYTISAATGAPQNPLDTLDLGFTFATSTIEVYFATAGQQLGPAGAAVRSWTPAEIAAAMAALEAIASVTNLSFVQTANQAGADFVFVLSDLEAGVLGQTWPSDTIAYVEFAPDAIGWTAAGLEPGGLGFSVIIHEAGHALGLDHPHWDGGDVQVMQGVIDLFGSYGTFQLNQQVFTIMSYNDGWPLGPDGLAPSYDYGYSATPMALDIGRLQQLYGADTDVNAGDTVYTLLDTDGAYEAIWDTGGIDTIAYNGSTSTVIVLRSATLLNDFGGGGYVSYVGGVYAGFTIANGVVIENATTGAGRDRIFGNEVANVLNGNAGDDELMGEGGDDTLLGGAGADDLLGGAGADALVGGDGADFLDGGTGPDTMSGGSGNDHYVVDDAGDVVVELADEGVDGVESSLATYALGDNVEQLTIVGAGLNGVGNALDNAVIGNELANNLSGGLGDDFLNGAQGDDTIDGGGGDDHVLARRTTLAGAESNIYIGGDGYDTIDFFGSNGGITVDLAAGTVTGVVAGTDTISGFEVVIGTSHDDIMIGDDGDNWFVPQTGGATIDGGGGVDTLDFSSFGISLDLATGAGNALGETLLVTGIENVIGNGTISGDNGANRIEGGGGGDLLSGAGGNDVILGGAGQDSINGGDGDDLLIGGEHADALDGGAGNDEIVYDAVDVAANVQGGTGTDTLVFLSGSAPTSFNLVAQGFERAEGRLTDTGGEDWATRTLAYDSLWRLDTETTVFDNGSRAFHDYDQTEQFAWSDEWTLYDALDRVDVVVTTFDDGTYSNNNHDQDDSFVWSSEWTRYDALDRVDTIVTTFDDATYSINEFDVAGVEPWSTQWTHYDGLDRVDTVFTTFDDGSYSINEFDVAEAQPWATQWTLYDALDRVDTVVTTYDDGSYAILDNDEADAFAWASQWWLYNSSGQVVAYQLIPDGGG